MLGLGSPGRPRGLLDNEDPLCSRLHRRPTLSEMGGDGGHRAPVLVGPRRDGPLAHLLGLYSPLHRATTNNNERLDHFGAYL